MKIEDANEADVQDEIAAPFLAALGYERGTANNIERERPLEYERVFLGRKKASDQPLRGRADYVLTVVGAGRWVLELKAPSDAIDIDAIEQAISYARHPAISAVYSVVLNGVRLTVHHRSQASTDAPLIELSVSDPVTLAQQLNPLLSPAAIRRDCRPPVVDLARPLAEGLRSRAEIRGGEIHHEQCQWIANVELPTEAGDRMSEVCRRLKGLRSTVTGGLVRRDESGRVRARLTWSMPHDELLKFALDKKLMDLEYLALDGQISGTGNSPTAFDVIGELEVKEGETIFNLVRWDTETAGRAIKVNLSGRATGYIEDYVFRGVFSSHHYCSFPGLPGLQLGMESQGTFRIDIDSR